MSKARSMYAGSSGSNYGVNKNSPGNGNGKWQGLWPSVGHARNTRYINTRAGGNNRNVVFCMNQLGGIGRKSNMFATTADGIQDCKHGHIFNLDGSYTPTEGLLGSYSNTEDSKSAADALNIAYAKWTFAAHVMDTYSINLDLTDESSSSLRNISCTTLGPWPLSSTSQKSKMITVGDEPIDVRGDGYLLSPSNYSINSNIVPEILFPVADIPVSEGGHQNFILLFDMQDFFDESLCPNSDQVYIFPTDANTTNRSQNYYNYAQENGGYDSDSCKNCSTCDSDVIMKAGCGVDAHTFTFDVVKNNFPFDVVGQPKTAVDDYFKQYIDFDNSNINNQSSFYTSTELGQLTPDATLTKNIGSDNSSRILVTQDDVNVGVPNPNITTPTNNLQLNLLVSDKLFKSNIVNPPTEVYPQPLGATPGTNLWNELVVNITPQPSELGETKKTCIKAIGILTNIPNGNIPNIPDLTSIYKTLDLSSDSDDLKELNTWLETTFTTQGYVAPPVVNIDLTKLYTNVAGDSSSPFSSAGLD